MSGILDGVEEIIDRFFDVKEIGTKPPHYGHKTACLRLSENPPDDLNGSELVRSIFNKIEKNWHRSTRRHKKPPSDENWRYEPHIDKEGTGPEVRLERVIAGLPKEGWVNQVPTSSGLVDHLHDRVRNIDLLRKIEPSRLEFIELKVESDTPLYAAMEILGYGLIYLFSGRHQDEFGYTPSDKNVLGATDVHLKVLAPYEYYAEYRLAWLQELINEGLKEFLNIPPDFGISMDFSFEAFPPDFHWSPGETDKSEVAAAVLNRQPVYSPPSP